MADMETQETQNIGVLAYGWVGKAMARLFLNHPDYKVFVYTRSPEKYKSQETDRLKFVGLDELNEKCELGIICAPTIETDSGEADISVVEELFSKLKTRYVLIKSTVPPGTTDYLNKKYNRYACMSPEYFGESKYDQRSEWQIPVKWPFLIIGGDKTVATEIMNIFIPVLGPEKTYAVTDCKTAELTKYAENIWGACKVIWANEFFNICTMLNISFPEMRELWALDPRVDKMHTAVFKNARGFAGKCYPKDLIALIRTSEKAGYNPKFLKEIWKSNKRIRGEEDKYKL